MLEGINQRKIEKYVRVCVNTIGTPEYGTVEIPLKAWSLNGISMTILNIEGVKAFNKLLEHLLQNGRVEDKPLEQIYAKKTLETKVQELITNVVNQYSRYATTKKKMQSAIEDWMLSFHADFPQQSFYVPIVNLKLASPLSIGKVTFYPLNHDFKAQLIRSYDYVVDSTKASDASKEVLKRRAVELLEEGDTLAETRFAVDTALGNELCIDYTEQTLNVLRYYGYFLYPPSHRAHIGIRGKISRNRYGILQLLPEKRSGLAYRRTGPLAAYDLSGQNLDKVRELGLEFLSKLLIHEPNSEFEIALLSAVEWLGRAAQTPQPEVRYLNLWIGVETLFTCDDDKDRDEKKGQLISERVSMIWTSVEQSEREKVKNLWNDKLYNVRNDIVHRGYSEVLSDYLAYLEYYAPLVIMDCIHLLMDGNTWQTKSQFLKWLESKGNISDN